MPRLVTNQEIWDRFSHNYSRNLEGRPEDYPGMDRCDGTYGFITTSMEQADMVLDLLMPLSKRSTRLWDVRKGWDARMEAKACIEADGWVVIQLLRGDTLVATQAIMDNELTYLLEPGEEIDEGMLNLIILSVP